MIIQMNEFHGIGMCDREYVQTICALVPSTLVASFDKTMRVFCFLYLLAKVNFPPFVDDFHLEMEVTLNQEAFVYVLAHSPYFCFRYGV